MNSAKSNSIREPVQTPGRLEGMSIAHPVVQRTLFAALQTYQAADALLL
jgi:hypothetical protein